MPNESSLTPEQDFQNKLKDRIRSCVGELMPDAALQKIIEQGIRSAFFDPIKTSERYGTVTLDEPWFHKFIRQTMEAKVKDALDKWIADNPQAVESAIKNVIEKGVAGCLVASLNNLFSNSMCQMQQNIQQMLPSLNR